MFAETRRRIKNIVNAAQGLGPDTINLPSNAGGHSIVIQSNPPPASLWWRAAKTLLFVGIGISIGTSRTQDIPLGTNVVDNIDGFTCTTQVRDKSKPVVGVIKYDGFIGEDALKKTERAAKQVAEDPTITAVAIQMNSTGGSSYYANMITNTLQRLKKDCGVPIPVGSIKSVAASAGLMIVSQAESVDATDNSSMVGSLGMLIPHGEISKTVDHIGKATIIRSNPHKAEGAFVEPLTDDAKKHMQAMVDDGAADFRKGLIELRGDKIAQMTPDEAARVYPAKMVIGKFVDRIVPTLEQSVRTTSGYQNAKFVNDLGEKISLRDNFLDQVNSEAKSLATNVAQSIAGQIRIEMQTPQVYQIQ